MNRKVNIKSLILIATSAIMLFFMGTKSYASQGYSAGMTLTSNSRVNAGENVTISAELNNVNAGDGVDVIVAKLNYNTNIFEAISESNFSSNTGWSISYAPSTNMIVASKDSKVNYTETVFNLNLKAIRAEATTITLTNIETSGGSVRSGGTGDIYINDQSITLSKGEEKQYSASANMDSYQNDNGTVTVNFNVNDVDAGEGINVISAKMNYDTDVFETVSQSDFSSNTGWSISYAPSTNRLVAVKDNKITSGETVFTVTLRIKTNIEQSSTISITDIEASGGSRRNGGTGDIEIDSTSTTLYVSNTADNNVTLSSNVQLADVTINNEDETKVIVDENGNLVKVADNKNKVASTGKLGKVGTSKLELNNEDNSENNDEETAKQNKIKSIVIGSVSVTTVLSGGLVLLKKFFII